MEAVQSGKATGKDQITADLLKDGGQIGLETLATLNKQCILTLSVPAFWKNARIILIHKIWDAKDTKNYKPMSLLSAAYQVFANVTCNRIRNTLDFNQPNDQAGFRKGYSTIENIHTINQVIEQCAEYN